MSNLKSLALLTFVLLSVSTVRAFSHEQTDQIPQDNLGEYQVQSCCPKGFNVAG